MSIGSVPVGSRPIGADRRYTPAAGGTNITAKTATVAINGVKAAVSFDVSITGKTATVPISGVKATVVVGTSVVAKTATVPITGIKASVTYDTTGTSITAKTATIAIQGVKATVDGVAASAGGGHSLTLRQMRALERMQIVDMIRRDDEEAMALIVHLLRRTRR